MKVTNEVRAYVNKKVREIYEEKKNDVQNKIDAELENVAAKLDELKEVVAKSLNDAFGDKIETSDVSIRINSYRGYGRCESSYQSPMNNKLSDEMMKINGFINDKTEDIVVELSLGGTKADLDRILEETKQSVQ